MKMKPAAKIYTALVFLFLFAPILILSTTSSSQSGSMISLQQSWIIVLRPL